MVVCLNGDVHPMSGPSPQNITKKKQIQASNMSWNPITMNPSAFQPYMGVSKNNGTPKSSICS